MQIRLLQAKDAHLYQLLRLEALQKNPRSFLSTYEVEKQRPLDYFTKEVSITDHSSIFGYWGVFGQNDDQLLAYVQLGKSYLVKQQHLAFIYNLYVANNSRRQGIAQKLVQHLLSLLTQDRSVEKIFLSCNAANQTALNFYRKIGFKEWGHKKKSVKWQDKNGETVYDDEIEMVYII